MKNLNCISEKKQLKKNTIKYLEGFEKIVETKNIDNIMYVIKFMANTIQGRLNTMVYYNRLNRYIGDLLI